MKKVFLTIITLILLIQSAAVFAAGADDMLKGKQDLVVLGSVKDIKNDIVTITVDHELGTVASSLVGKDIDVSRFTYSYCEEHSTSEFRSPIISDNVVISLNVKDGKYTMANCAYKVDSNEYANCRIVVLENGIDDKCALELLEATCYIRANAMVNEFDYDSEGRIYAVYPQSIEQCVRLAGEEVEDTKKPSTPDALPVVPNAPMPPDGVPPMRDHRGVYSILIIALGAVGGALVSYVIYTKKNK